VLLEQEDDAHEQVVEVDGVILGQLPLVGGVDPGRGLVVVVRRLLAGGGDVGELVLALADPGQHAGRPEALLVEVEVLQHGLDERHLIGPVVDREASRQTDGFAVAPQDPRADGVKGADGRLARSLLADQPGDALAHLVRRLVRERDRHDLPGLVARRDEIRHPVGENPGLPAAGAGEDEQRPGQVADRLPLRRIEAVENLLRRQTRSRWRTRGGVGGHRPDSSAARGTSPAGPG
jgi:hypothetical protein